MSDPGKPLGMSDFFALEAGEYLERLDALFGQPGPSVDEFVRLARALRGSALMAQKPPIARAAAGLEAVARALREGRRSWDAATKQLSIRGLDDLKALVRHSAEWGEADRATAEAVAAELERAVGAPAAPRRAAAADQAPALDAGARAFVAREGAAIASALARAVQGLRVNPKGLDQLRQVVRALQPLRGLAALNDLQPLPDLLEGIERSIEELSRPGFKPLVPSADLFQAADGAIARAAREVAEQGRPNPEAPEFRQFADLLLRFSEPAPEPDAVSITTLFHDDAGPHIVRQGGGDSSAAPDGIGSGPSLSRLELVSQGEHLRQAADALERAPSATQRELRAHTLAGTFRMLAGAGGGPLAGRLAEFAGIARDTIASGAAARNAAEFAALLRDAGGLLARSGSGDEAALAAEFAPFVAKARALTAAAPPAPPAAPRMTRDGVDQNGGGLAATWTAYENRTATGMGPASLDELLRPPLPRPPTPTPTPAPTSATGAGAPQGGAPVVEIGALLYRGERARARAQELREEASRASGDRLRQLIDELYDLVAQALQADA